MTEIPEQRGIQRDENAGQRQCQRHKCSTASLFKREPCYNRPACLPPAIAPHGTAGLLPPVALAANRAIVSNGDKMPAVMSQIQRRTHGEITPD